jgi:uncharacterized repeat protein (TIGR02543 family)
MNRVSLFLILVTLIAGMVGCSSTGTIVTKCHLTISSTAGGSVTTPGEGAFTYNSGAVVHLMAAPDAGYGFIEWTGDVSHVADVNAATTTITMNGDYSVTANFVAVHSLTISSTAGGSVTTPGEGVYTYDHGTVVGLVATPDAGYDFVGWTGDVSRIARVNAANTTVTVNSDYSVTANFVAVHSLTISSTAGGSVTSPGEGVYTYDDGMVVDLVATADADYQFANWTGDVEMVASGNAATTTVTVNGDYSIEANFVPVHSLTIFSTAGGSVTIPGEGTFNYGVGAFAALVATADAGYRFVNWTGDVDMVGDVNAVTTTITMNGDYAIAANFEVIPMVAAGYHHTVGLRSDGIVVVAGDSTYGQCNVAGWAGIIQVAAGSDHTVGLKSDGTVVAVGYNDYGECNVAGWTDIIQVSAGRYHTVGLKSDGTVIAVGWNYYGQCNVAGWTDIIQVSAGFYHTVGVKADGTVVAVGLNERGQCDVGGWMDITQVAAGSDHSVGLKSDGAVVAVGLNNYGQCNVAGWTDIAQVAAGQLYTVGLKSDGTVEAVGDNTAGQCNVAGWTGIIQVAAGWEHTVGLKPDGSMVAVGDNSYNQCNVAGWYLS